MSDITSSYIVMNNAFLEDFIVGKQITYDETNHLITASMSFKKINNDSANSDYKVGNIATQYRPTSQLKYIYSYCSYIPPNYITETNSHNIDVGNAETNITVDANGDLIIRPDSTYKNGSITSFNMSYTA